MTELEQKKLEAIRQCMIDLEIYDGSRDCCAEILTAIQALDEPKTEPLEVVIGRNGAGPDYFWIDVLNEMTDFKSKEEAIAFCKRHNLRIKE